MLSYKTQLHKIGIEPGSTISYRSFFLPPRSLKQAMRSMSFPVNFSEVVPGTEQDENGTDEIQGVTRPRGISTSIATRR